MSFEENGEMDKALAAYRKVLDVDPGQIELAGRVASLLARQDDFPEAIDILKDAIKATPNAPEPLLQLAFIYCEVSRPHRSGDRLRQSSDRDQSAKHRCLRTSLRSRSGRG